MKLLANVLIALMTLLVNRAFAQPYKHEVGAGFALGAFIRAGSSKNSMTQFVYVGNGLIEGHNLLKTNREDALKLVGLTNPRKWSDSEILATIPPQLSFTGLEPAYPSYGELEMYRKAAIEYYDSYSEQQFVNDYHAQLVERVKGIKLSETPLPVLMNGLISFTSVPSPIFGATLATGYSAADYFAGNFTQNTYFKKPAQLASINRADAMLLGEKIMTGLSNPLLRPYLEGDLSSFTGLDNFSGIYDEPGVRIEMTDKRMTLLKQEVERLAAARGAEKYSVLSEQGQRMLDMLGHLQPPESSSSEDGEQQLEDVPDMREREARDFQDQLEAIQEAARFLGTIARAMGAEGRTVKAIETAAVLANSFLKVQNLGANASAWALAGPYFAAASAVVEFAMYQDGNDPNQIIIKSLQEISKKLDQMHQDITDRLKLIDQNMSIGFAKQESLLKAISSMQDRHSESLARIERELKKGQTQLTEYLVRKDISDRSLEFKNCRSYGAEWREGKDSKIRDCLNLAVTMAMIEALDPAPANFESTLPPSASGDVGLKAFYQLGSNRISYFGKKRREALGDEFQVASIPDVFRWQWGASELVHLAKTYPRSLAFIGEHESPTSVDEQLSKVLLVGQRIQSNYRLLFARAEKRSAGEVDAKWPVYRVDLGLISDLTKSYSKAAENYVKSLEDKGFLKDLPLTSPSQYLPEEQFPAHFVKDANSPNMPPNEAPQFFEWTQPWVNQATGSKLAKGRYPIRGNFPLIDNMKPCDGFEFQSTDTSDAARMPQLEGIRVPSDAYMASFATDVANIKEHGLPIDGSLLQLYPRPALWLAKIDREHFKLGACLRKYVGNYDGFIGNSPQITVKASLDLYVRAGERLIVVARANTFMKFDWNPNWLYKKSLTMDREGLRQINFVTSKQYPPILIAFGAMLDKNDPNEVRVGPIQGNFDVYFTNEPKDQTLTANEIEVGNLVSQVVKVKTENLVKLLRTDEFYKMLEAYAELNALRSILPPDNEWAQKAMDDIKHKLVLLPPCERENNGECELSTFADMMLDGRTSQQVIAELNRKFYKFARTLTEYEKNMLPAPPMTPVDQTVEQVRLLRDEFNEVRKHLTYGPGNVRTISTPPKKDIGHGKQNRRG